MVIVMFFDRVINTGLNFIRENGIDKENIKDLYVEKINVITIVYDNNVVHYETGNRLLAFVVCAILDDEFSNVKFANYDKSLL